MKPAVRQLLFGSQFTPAKLFLGDAPGLWFDRQDLSSMYQDAAGTTACAVGSPVGLALDKSKGAGPVLSGVTVQLIPGAGTAVDNGNGTYTATNGGLVRLNYPLAQLVNGQYYRGVVTIDSISVTAGNATLDWSDQPGLVFTTPGQKQVIAARSTYDATFRFLDVAAPATGSITFALSSVTVTALPGNHATQGTAASRPILRQDASGRYYLEYDGFDDGMATAAVDFTAADKVTAFAGVYKASDAAIGTVVELGNGGVSTTGLFNLLAPQAAAQGSYAARSGGSLSSQAVASGFAAPSSVVATVTADIPGDSVILRLNGAQAASSILDQGTGTFANQPLYIGRRGGTTLPFNGRDYGLIVVGRALSATEIARAERFLASRMGVTL